MTTLCTFPGCQTPARIRCPAHAGVTAPKPCSYPGCTELARARKVLRCETHKGMRLPKPPRPKRVKRPTGQRWWCTPCHRFVYSLIHYPARKEGTP